MLSSHGEWNKVEFNKKCSNFHECGNEALNNRQKVSDIP